MKWASSFKYLPIEFDFALAKIEDRTMRVSFRNNLSGSKVRILLSNRYAAEPLKIEKMSIGIGGDTIVETPVPVTVNGSASFVLEPDEERFSDELPLEVTAGQRLVVSVYLKERQRIGSICSFSTEKETGITWNHFGDATDGRAFGEEVRSDEIFGVDAGPQFYGFSAVQVYTDDEVKVIAAFGDSITHMSFITNDLMDRLYQAYPGRVSLINCGISGNRLVHDATFSEQFPSDGRIFGDAGVKRFERDVFGTDETDVVLVLEGINDIMHPIQFEGSEKATSPEELEAGFRRLADIARAHGARIYGATILPSGSPEYPPEWISAFEESRCAVNAWLRGASPFDGIFDYDLGVRDASRPDYMSEGCSIGDGLHPNEEGARRAVDQIDLKMLVG